MPDTLEIREGPPFRKFLFLSMIATDHGWIQDFTFWDGQKEYKEKLTVSSIGRFPVGQDYDEDIFSFVAFRQGMHEEGYQYFFYVGQYNIRTRKGICECYTRDEFNVQPVAQSLIKKRPFALAA